MEDIEKLLEGNKKWADNIKLENPDYFKNLSELQSPKYLWIGCSDSRIPSSMVTGTKPGEIFVHRNIANIAVHTDMNLLSVLSFAVEVLKVKHIIVCGHYNCGGINAALSGQQYGLIDNWLRHLKDVYKTYHVELDGISDPTEKANKFTEYNVREQVLDICKTTIVQNAWKNNQELQLHGFIYDLKTGYLKNLELDIKGISDIHSIYHMDDI